MSSWLKILLEIGPLVVFFGAFQWFRDAPVVYGGQTYEAVVLATLFFIPAILASLLASRLLTGKLPRMAVVTAVVVVVFGGLTLALNDDTFIKMKPTIINGLFALGLMVGLAQGRSYLKYLLEEAMPLTDEGWMIFTRRWALFLLFMALLNEAIWRTQDTAFWVNFKTFGSPLVTLTFIVAQAPLLKRHAVE
jgi:intracellular septation protein